MLGGERGRRCGEVAGSFFFEAEEVVKESLQQRNIRTFLDFLWWVSCFWFD